MAKLTSGEAGEVVERIKLLIIKAHTDRDIAKTFAKELGVQPRQINVYIKRAHEQLAEENQFNLHEEKAKAVKRYELIINKCIAAGQYKTAALTQVQLDKLLGTQEPERFEHTHSGKKGGEPIAINGFQATIIDARARAEKMREQLEKERLERNGG